MILQVFQALTVLGIDSLNDVSYTVESPVDRFKSPVDRSDSLVDRSESPVHRSKSPVYRVESGVYLEEPSTHFLPHLCKAETHLFPQLLESFFHRCRDGRNVLLQVLDPVLHGPEPGCRRGSGFRAG